MKRRHFLAAELFNYSFDNYENHLGIGNARFDELIDPGKGYRGGLVGRKNC